MSFITIEKEELKELIKESIREILQEDEFEDLLFGKMIEDGDTGEYIQKEEILKTLNKI